MRWKLIEQRILQSKRLSDPAVWLLVLWGMFILYATLLPFDFSASAEVRAQRIQRIWAHPLRGGSWADVRGNVGLFVPFGLLLAIVLGRRGAGFIFAVAAAMCSGAVLSGSVELCQLFAPMRSCSFIDLVTNSFGATVGAIMGWPWIRLVWPVLSVRVRQWITTRPLATCAVVTGASIFLSGLSPFGFKPRPHELRLAFRSAQWVPFGPHAAEPLKSTKTFYWAAELLMWTLAGGLFALGARESRVRGVRPIGWAIGTAVLLSVAIEGCQLAIPDRDVDATSVVLALVGSASGAIAVVRLLHARDPYRLIPPAIAIWLAAAVLTLWNPPQIRLPKPPYWNLAIIVPFWTYFQSRTIGDLADVLGMVLIFMPLGGLLAARSNRQSFVGAVLIGLLLSVVFEFGQAFLPTRTPDISDVCSAAGGTALGFALWRWGQWIRTSSIGAIRYRVR